jgi:hypothetical protein
MQTGLSLGVLQHVPTAGFLLTRTCMFAILKELNIVVAGVSADCILIISIIMFSCKVVNVEVCSIISDMCRFQ